MVQDIEIRKSEFVAKTQFLYTFFPPKIFAFFASERNTKKCEILGEISIFANNAKFSQNDLPLSLETLLELNVFISRVVKRVYTEPGLMKDELQEYLKFHRHGEI